MKCLQQFSILATLCVCVFGAKLPPTFKTCPRTMRDLNSCLLKNVQQALRDLEIGYAPLGIYPIDPLRITAIDIDQGSGPVSINLKFRDLDIKGLRFNQIKEFKGDVDNMVFTAKVDIPKIDLDGKYTIDGKVLILPIKGDGIANLSVDDVSADFIMAGKELKKDGKVYMKLTKFDFTLDTKKLTINLSNLFNGDKALGDNMNKFLNENSLDILKELKPAIQQTFGLAFGDIANRLFTKVPYDDIFPKN